MKNLFRAAIYLVGFALFTAACDKPEASRGMDGRGNEGAEVIEVTLGCPASCPPDQGINLFETATSTKVVGSVAQNTKAVRLQAPTIAGGKEYCNVSVERAEGGSPLVGWLTCDYVQLANP